MLIKHGLSKEQYKFLASFFKTIADGIVLGSLAALFLPEALQLNQAIPFGRFMILALAGLLLLVMGVILERRGG